MSLLLAISSVLAGWALLGVLVFGLLFIIKTLQGVRARMEKITMGVRAIEQQVSPLGRSADAAGARLDTAADTTSRLADRLRETDHRLKGAAGSLRTL